MEKKFIATGKTYDAAKQAALDALNLTEDQVTIVVVLERGKPGIFGIGARPWKVEVTYEVPDPKPASALSSASRSKPKKAEPVVKAETPKVEPPKPVKPQAEAPKAPVAPPPPVKPAAPVASVADEEPRQMPPKVRSEKPHQKNNRDRGPRGPKAPGQGRGPKAPREPREPREPKAPREPRVYTPAEPGSMEETIETFLKGLLEHMGSAAVPHAIKGEENAYRVYLEGEGLGALIGRRGDTLDAIQHLTNYAANRTIEGHIRVTVDAEDYRLKREESLRRYARKKAQQVLRVRRRTMLEPMNAYERHVIHSALQEMDNITTYSTGTEPNRRVIIEYVR